MKKKLICTILILNLIFVPCYQSYADAGTLTVAGGSLSIGGLGAGAVAGLAGPAVVAVFCGMLAVGVDIELTQASQEAGMTKTEYLKTKINQYCNEAGKTADVFYKSIAGNMSVTKDGAIEIGNEASLQLKQFINWLYNNDMVNSPSQVGSGSSVNIGNVTFPVSTVSEFRMTGDTRNCIMTFSEPVAFALCYAGSQGNKVIVAFTKTSGVTCTENYYGTIRTLNLHGYRNGYYYLQSRYFPNTNLSFATPTDMPSYNVLPASFLDTLDGSFDMSNTGTADGFTGDRDEWNDKSGILDPTQGYPTTINPGLIGQIPIPSDTDITTNVRDYLDALEKVLNGIQDRVIQGIDTADGIPRDWDIPDTVAIDPTIQKKPPVPDSDSTPVTNDKPVDPGTEPTVATEPLKFDLTNIFPFCIPFDIKDMFSLLNAEPVAPRYTVDWDLPFIQQNFTFTIDLTPWSDVALILRKMELLAFVIGLALVTRNLIRG